MPDRPSGGRPTIYDVADEAGVAISTVSRVINASSEVSDVTRGRVQDAIRKLQFQPQRTARILAQKSTTSVAVALPSATSLFFVEMLKGVKDALRDKDIDLLLCNLGSAQPYPTLRRFLDRGAVDALLLMALPIEGDATDQLLNLQAPVVLLGSRHPDLDAYWWDDEAGAFKATSYLLEQGHERIGLISAQSWSTNAAPRLDGYKRALAEASVEFDPSLVVAGKTAKHAGYSEEAGAEAMEQLLDLEDRPTAVFAASDVQAYGAWAKARDMGVRVPRDISIVGYDDLKTSRFLDLTSVAQGMHLAGRVAMDRLLSRLSGDSNDRVDVQLPLTLNVRSSSGPARR
ncbi:LacI family DNA-binding transcriptional regulator [Rubrivirga sp.]|uniref:LacI family DNA-binding transcriptional regulator n=1 Tax=Rubrivirga sp. TaxID=1885344 RepID=UPI003C796619